MSIPIPPTYFVNWVDGQLARRAFDYNISTHVLTPTAFTLANSRMLLTQDDSEAALYIDGNPVLTVQSDGEIGCGFISTAIYKADFPRLEFYRQVNSVPKRFAAIGVSGIFSVLNLIEDVPPIGSDRVRLWTDNATVGLDGLYCGNLREIKLAKDRAGLYLMFSDRKLIEFI